MLTNHLIKCLDKRVRDAKSAGDFDIGIQTLTGNNVSVKKTRAFNFRGSEAKDESVLVHSVVIDRGMSSDAALKVYGEAIQADQRGSKIQTGFYIDGRALFKQCKPVYLVLSLGRTSPNAVVVRPNDGRTCFNIDHVMSRFVQPSLRCDDMAKVRKAWDAEFALDIGSDDYYQKWSKGRHRKPTHIFGGKIVPVINKLLAATLPRLDDTHQVSLPTKDIIKPKIVRIEVGSVDGSLELSLRAKFQQPKLFVGIEFPEKNMDWVIGSDELTQMPKIEKIELWKYVLRNLAEKIWKEALKLQPNFFNGSPRIELKLN
ncbi:hypothetical protein THAOC_15220 [Thalassiosira oceanica]|uniref:Uncharacterized protein n=1 Tax=Thalassiosira oceanica TaxID=159749 RepID=K0SSV1_THAOC|nr:hypothetical protein THAOC_15220 [Thalassiosira oceanica]|eukprot:EJK64081.1 hypothetical protein THAOC_15220 [Thalassiosira oceanica]